MDFILKSTLVMALLFAIYILLLENEKMHQFNRFYLLASLVFSIAVPFLSFEIKSQNDLLSYDGIVKPVLLTPLEMRPDASFSSLLWVIYGLITAVLLVRFIVNLWTIRRKINSGNQLPFDNATLVLVSEKIIPHTFLQYIFINATDYENHKIESELFTHEFTHVNQKHTVDILFVEFLKILFWFNPMLWLYRKAIKLNHEFLADSKVVETGSDIPFYQNLLLSKAGSEPTFSLASNLNFLITKKRLMMMTKTTSVTKANLKKALILPLFLALAFFLSAENATAQIAPKKQTKAVATALPANETAPEYPGGLPAFYKFFYENYKIPTGFTSDQKLIIGFTITKDGSLDHYKIVKDLGSGTAEEAIRVLKLCPKWKPGTKDMLAADTEFYLPITLQQKK